MVLILIVIGSLGNQWQISNGKANGNGTGGQLKQTLATPINAGTYVISYDISEYVSGVLRVGFEGIVGTDRSSNGSFTDIITITSVEDILNFNNWSRNFVGSIDNVSVKEITNAVIYKNIPQSARNPYTLEGLNWIGSELAVPINSYNLSESTIFTSDSTGISVDFTGGSAVGSWLLSSPLETYTDYKVSVNVSDHTRGGLSARLRTGSTVFLLPEGLGVNSAIIKSGGGGSTTIRTRTNQPVELTYNSVSVKEIIEVEPLFTIDSLFINNEQGIWFDMGKE